VSLLPAAQTLSLFVWVAKKYPEPPPTKNANKATMTLYMVELLFMVVLAFFFLEAAWGGGSKGRLFFFFYATSARNADFVKRCNDVWTWRASPPGWVAVLLAGTFCELISVNTLQHLHGNCSNASSSNKAILGRPSIARIRILQSPSIAFGPRIKS
jgi:hypothetical protein